MHRDSGVDHEVVVVGAGAAGLAAAALLARCKRDVLVIGAGDRANVAAEVVHNVPFAEGLPPDEFYAALEQRVTQLGVPVLDGWVEEVEVQDGRDFVRVLGPTGPTTASRLLLATGLDHDVPAWVPAGRWGRSVFSCPFCHASEHDGEAFAVVGAGTPTIEAALMCRPFASSLTVFVTDPAAVDSAAAREVRASGGEVVVDAIVAAEAPAPDEVVLVSALDRRVRVGAVLVPGVLRARSNLTDLVGLTASATGLPEVDAEGRSAHPLIWLAGNAAKPYYMLAEAVASGVRAAVSLHRDLTLAPLR
ncbi:hypothetical protein SUDANB95_04824 [Actinosynnema sp. ALI-1.44]